MDGGTDDEREDDDKADDNGGTDDEREDDDKADVDGGRDDKICNGHSTDESSR